MYKYLISEKKDGVAVITFNRPDQLNAMCRAFMDEIIDAFTQANNDSDVKAVVVTGNGRAFMSGADIKEYAAQTDEEFLAFQKRGWEMYDAAEKSTKPYICAVNGFALGGGFEIALACDMIVASEDAVFGLPEVHLGLVPGGGGTQRLISKLGLNRVHEILYTGGKFTAAKMHEWGVVNYLTTKDELMATAMDVAMKMTRRNPLALAQLKRLSFLSTCPVPLAERMKDEAQTVYELYHTPEAKEKINAFASK